MDPITIIGLIFALIRLAIQVYSLLKDHPEITQAARDMFARAHYTAAQIQADMQAQYPDYAAVQAP
jgi:hypothetical protein